MKQALDPYPIERHVDAVRAGLVTRLKFAGVLFLRDSDRPAHHVLCVFPGSPPGEVIEYVGPSPAALVDVIVATRDRFSVARHP